MSGTEHEKSSSKLQAGIILFCGTVAAMFWFVFSSSVFEQWGRKCSFLPDRLYYPIEEFLALHSHQNDPYTYGISFVIASFFAWFAHRLCRELKSWCRGVFFAFLVLLLLALLFPCLCRPREIGRRARCQYELKQIYMECANYAGNNGGCFPDSIDTSKLKHKISYHGKNKKSTGEPFILLEDGENVHAGNMQHRIWSDGELEQFYPWK